MLHWVTWKKKLSGYTEDYVKIQILKIWIIDLHSQIGTVYKGYKGYTRSFQKEFILSSDKNPINRVWAGHLHTTKNF